MQTVSDLTIPLSRLVFTTDYRATLANSVGEPAILGALVKVVTARHIQSGLETGMIHLVSSTYDVTGEVSDAAPLTFESVIDRKTRTLVFANGLVTQDDQPVLRATFVFRISA